MAVFIYMLSFFLTGISSAQDCSCAVIQCDPCQKKIVIDKQIKQCTEGKTVLCDNSVCENVNNYFQCIAGAPALYIPPQDLQDRETEPRLPLLATPKESSSEDLKFKHFNHIIEEKVSPEERPGTGLMRGLASDTEVETDAVHTKSSSNSNSRIKPFNDPEAEYLSRPLVQNKVEDIVLKGLRGGLSINNKKNSRQSLRINSLNIALKSSQNQTLDVTYGKTNLRLYMAKSSEAHLSKEDEYLVLRPISGNVAVSSIRAHHMFVLDAGDWRFGKSSGSISATIKGEEVQVKSSKGEVLVRRDQLIAPSESISEPIEFIVSKHFGIVAATKEQPANIKNSTLYETQGNPRKKIRAPASSEFFPALEGCDYPKATANQCAWKCFGATGKTKTCENSDITQCVRFTCTDGGLWKLPTRVSGKECAANSVKIDSCQ
jgi:hypothetical protein